MKELKGEHWDALARSHLCFPQPLFLSQGVTPITNTPGRNLWTHEQHAC